jgi:predicted regulator of Ras-like GTPase activity (Roadblock/LC7/MglB family)
MLADITGHLIEEQGNGNNLFNTAALSALAAGELAATKEMARLVGEEARFKLLLHEGVEQSVYLSDVSGEMILVTVFDNTTPIGMIRLWTRNVVEELTTILEQAKVQQSTKRRTLIDESFEQLLANELDIVLSED